MDSLSLEDFSLIKEIQVRQEDLVYLAMRKDNHKIYALRILQKIHLINNDMVKQSMDEKEIIMKINHPFCMQVEFCAATFEHILYGNKFYPGGVLEKYLKKYKTFEESTTKFYAAQIVLAFGYLHSMNIINRYLNPREILIDKKGYICINNFINSKALETSRSRAQSTIGIPDYMAPEITQTEEYGYEVDWWILGVLIYEFIYGNPPFYTNKGIYETYRKISQEQVAFPDKPKVSEDCKDIIRKLLAKKPNERLGNKKDSEEIKAHKWFSSINFDDILSKKVKSPIDIQVKHETDFKNYLRPDQSEIFGTNKKSINNTNLTNKDIKLLTENESLWDNFAQKKSRCESLLSD